MKFSKLRVGVGLMLVVGVLGFAFLTKVGPRDHSARASIDKTQVVATDNRNSEPKDAFSAFRVDLADRSAKAEDGLPTKVSVEELSRIRSADTIEMNPSSANTRVAQDTSTGRIILASNSEETCMFQHDRGEPSDTSLPLSGGCTQTDIASDARTPMVFWGPNGKEKMRITFLVPDTVNETSVRTSDGVVHQVPIINNTGDIFVSDKQDPVFEWNTKDGQRYKKTLSFGPSTPDRDSSR